jgi:hypothetical protein
MSPTWALPYHICGTAKSIFLFKAVVVVVLPEPAHEITASMLDNSRYKSASASDART